MAEHSGTYTESDVEGLIGLSPLAQKRLRLKGNFCPHVRIGKKTLYRVDTFNEWLEELEAKSREQAEELHRKRLESQEVQRHQRAEKIQQGGNTDDS